jgi:glyoxylase-like metal-dependent hydrolase (beta-lactamase superfamily II)
MTVHTIDLLFQGRPGLIAAYLIENGDERVLVETGPFSCHQALLQGLSSVGCHWDTISDVLLTHIHLDHAGGAGWWAQQGKNVWVHPSGQPHLVDPSKLIASASRIYGDRMQELWGDIPAGPEARVHAAEGGATLDREALQIELWDTPGHARHHLAFSVEDHCFTGDVAGVSLQDLETGIRTAYLSAATAPPQFELSPYLQSIRSLAAQGFASLHLAHFGTISGKTAVAAHWSAYEQKVSEVFQRVSTWVAAGLTSEAIAEAYTAEERIQANRAGISDAAWDRWQLANGTIMSAKGLELASRL